MHYNSSRWMKLVNALFEFLLLLGSFWAASLLRVVSPVGEVFAIQDAVTYFPLAVVYAGVMVCCYAVIGGYETLHFRGVFKLALRLAIADVAGFALVATLLYVFRLSQFSRLLLGYFYLLSVFVLLAKRILFSRLATRYVLRHNMQTNLLLLGSGRNAQRFYRDVVQKGLFAVRYVGYLDAHQTAELPGYLGDWADFADIAAAHRIDMVVVASETQNSYRLRRLITQADAYHIRVCVIPVYNDFITASSNASLMAGLHLWDIKLLDTCDIMGVNIVVTDMQKTLDLIGTKLEDWRGKYICVANVHTTVTAHENTDYREVQNGAVMALPDGGPLSQYSREHGYTAAQRVTGPDLMQQVLAISAQKGWRHYFYGSTQETLDKLAAALEEKYPGAKVVGMYSPPFRALTPEEDAKIVAQINAAEPDFVWVGLGAPKQELWMAAHEDRVRALMVGVGAAFDYEAGNIHRAPLWMQKHNLEWLYRLLQDPKRLFKRYFVTNTKYLLWKFRH